MALSNVPEPAETVFHMQALTSTPFTAAKIKLWSRRDRILSKIIDLVLHGWQYLNDQDLKPYEHRKDELSPRWMLTMGKQCGDSTKWATTSYGFVSGWSSRCLKNEKFSSIYIWWPGMDQDLENRVKECEAYQRTRNQPPASPLMLWELPQTPGGDYMETLLAHMKERCSSYWWMHILFQVIGSGTDVRCYLNSYC